MPRSAMRLSSTPSAPSCARSAPCFSLLARLKAHSDVNEGTNVVYPNTLGNTCRPPQADPSTASTPAPATFEAAPARRRLVRADRAADSINRTPPGAACGPVRKRHGGGRGAASIEQAASETTQVRGGDASTQTWRSLGCVVWRSSGPETSDPARFGLDSRKQRVSEGEQTRRRPPPTSFAVQHQSKEQLPYATTQQHAHEQRPRTKKKFTGELLRTLLPLHCKGVDHSSSAIGYKNP